MTTDRVRILQTSRVFKALKQLADLYFLLLIPTALFCRNIQPASEFISYFNVQLCVTIKTQKT